MVSPDVFNQVFRPIIFVFRLAGLWPSGNRTLIYIVYGTAFFFIFSFALTVSELVQLIKFTESANLTQNMFMTLTDLAVLLKFVNFYWRWHSMQELYETARDFERETVAEVKLFNKRMRFNYWIVLLLFISVNTAHAGAELKTIWSPDLLLPFPAWYPPSWLDGGVMYWLTYAHNSLSHLIGSNLVSAIDGFPTSLLFMVSVQMEILGSRLKSLGDDGPLTHTGHLKNGESRMRNLQCRKRIIKCIQTHQQILEFTKKIENNFTMPLLAEICVSGTVSCCLIGEVAINNDLAIQLNSGAMLFALGLLIYMPCYVGNEIIVKSDELSNRLYESKWISMRLPERKLIIIVMERFKRTTLVMVGWLFILGLGTFTSIVNFAYRLLTVMRNSDILA